MDGQRFDEIARLIGTGASRRRMLKGLTASLLGLGGMRIAQSGASAGGCILTGVSCEDNGTPCCGDSVCAGVPRMCVSTTSCVGGDGPCNTDTGPACCEGLVCDATDGANGACVVPACAEEFESCSIAECCGDLICMSGSSTCEVCRAVDEACGGDGECCSGSCNSGTETCVAVEEPTCAGIFDDCSELSCCGDAICATSDFGSVCFRPDECPFAGDSCAKGYCCSSTCVDNICTAICSDMAGAVCEGEGDCCAEAGLSCVEGICTFDVCREVDESCGVGVLCCDDLECVDGACTEPVVVPDPECEVDADCVVAAAGSIDAVICCAGVCRELECCIDDILDGGNPNDRCGDGETCFEGLCISECEANGDCTGDACCCDDGSCAEACCPDPEHPVTLPNTGVADGDGGLSGLMTAGLAVGAAALLAGAKLRPSEE